MTDNPLRDVTPLRDKALCVLMGKGLTMSHAQAVDALLAAGLLHDTHDPAGGWPRFPRVQGTCPACGAHSLFLGKGGYVTCAILTCDDPCRASDILLASPPPAVRTVTTTNTQTVVPPRDDEARIERAIVAVNRVRLLPASALNGQSRSEAIARAALAAADQEEQA